MKFVKQSTVFTLLAMALAVIVSCSSGSDDTEVVSSRAYSGHESDVDANNFVNVYPITVGTRLDNCQTCHRAGVPDTDTAKIYNPCDYCHLLEFPDSRLETGVPQNFQDTLNTYGLAYKQAGQNREALQSIGPADSDEDGFTNTDEILSLRYPGNPESHPGQPLAPTVDLSAAQISAMPRHSQFMLMVTTRQQFDDYVTYDGVTIKELLVAAGVDLYGAEGITVFAPDGFGKDFSMDEINQPFPKGIFYQTPEFPDYAMELVNYPAPLPSYAKDRTEIPDTLYLMLADTRDGFPLDVAYYDDESGKLTGEGPFRLVLPQRTATRPDRSINLDPYSDGWDYSDEVDHNAGSCVRGACVIRVNPMPVGVEEFDWKNGWSLIEDLQVVIYGHGVTN